MDVRKYLNVRVDADSGVATITPSYPGVSMVFKCASVDVGAVEPGSSVSLISFPLEKEQIKEHEQVVVVSFHSHDMSDWLTVAIPVRWWEKSEKIIILLDECNFCSSDPERILQIVERDVRVVIGDVTYSTSPHAQGATDERYVEDGSLLCRYVVGTATAEEVEKAASDVVEEVDARKQALLLNAEVLRLTEIISRAHTDLGAAVSDQ